MRSFSGLWWRLLWRYWVFAGCLYADGFILFFANNCADVVCFVGVGLSPRGRYFVYFVLLILGFCSW